MDKMDISLKIGDLGVDLRYHFELYPNGKYGFSYSGYEGDRRCETRVMVYTTRSECASDMAQNIKNQVLIALGQPEEA